MLTIMKKLVFLSILMSILLASCTVTEQMDIKKSASQSATEIHVQDFFISVLEDYSQFMPENDQSIMDSAVTTFAGQIEDTDDGRDTLFIKTGDNSYTGTFTFDNITHLAEELGGQEQSIVIQDDNSLTFFCSIDNYTQLESIVPFLADPNIAVYLAQYNIGYSEDDYMEMITFALGAEAPDALRSSMITFNITVPGSITSLEGARQTGSDSFTYSFPLIDFLLLAQPLSFSVSWS